MTNLFCSSSAASFRALTSPHQGHARVTETVGVPAETRPTTVARGRDEDPKRVATEPVGRKLVWKHHDMLALAGFAVGMMLLVHPS